jgi:hypothetical protein
MRPGAREERKLVSDQHRIRQEEVLTQTKEPFPQEPGDLAHPPEHIPENVSWGGTPNSKQTPVPPLLLAGRGSGGWS